MRKVITFLVAVALIGMFFISFVSASTIEKENSTGELVGMVIGALLAGIIGIVTVGFTQHREAKKTKKYIASAHFRKLKLSYSFSKR
jgi:NADH:ubiquinone oxidoreductase subunit 6 (subunit J)